MFSAAFVCLFVCLLATLLKGCERIAMKFQSLDFGSDLDHDLALAEVCARSSAWNVVPVCGQLVAKVHHQMAS